MRSLIVMAMFVASLSSAAWNGYTESRNLELSADGVDRLEIDDGSRPIRIRSVGGRVRIDDGSGGIWVEDVEGDLDIVSDGSGSVRLADVRGAIRHDD